MIYLYLDESGDLGFDFVNKRPSKFFTITILAISRDHKNLISGVKKTLRRKLNPKRKRRRIVQELKATGTKLEIKKYFYRQIQNLTFSIYSITLNKKRVYEDLTRKKNHIYNYVARKVIDKIPLERATTRIELILDKSKAKPEIENFNKYIIRQLQGRLDPRVPLDIYHWKSNESAGLQAVDLFCWGIFKTYESEDSDWFNVYKEKIRLNELYLPNKK